MIYLRICVYLVNPSEYKYPFGGRNTYFTDNRRQTHRITGGTEVFVLSPQIPFIQTRKSRLGEHTETLRKIFKEEDRHMQTITTLCPKCCDKGMHQCPGGSGEKRNSAHQNVQKYLGWVLKRRLADWLEEPSRQRGWHGPCALSNAAKQDTQNVGRNG